MSNKSLKDSIRRSIKENILNEKWSDAVPQAISGIANMGRNIAGQYSLGTIDKKLQRVGDRIEKDWDSAADEVANKANKLTTSKNQMIAKQGELTLKKVDNISNQIKNAMQILKTPLDKMGSSNMEFDPNDPLAKHPEEKAFEQWLRNSGGRPQNLNKNEYGKYFQKWRQLRALGLDPTNIPIQNLEREVAIAAHKRGIELKDLDAELRRGNKYKMGLGPEFVEGGEGEGSEDGEEDISHTVPPPPPKKAAPQVKIQPPPAPPSVKGNKKDIFGDLVMQNQGKAPAASQQAPKAPSAPSYEDAGIPTLDNKKASGGNVGAAKPILEPFAPNMQSPARQKGKASPPPVSHPAPVQPKTTHKGLDIPKMPEAPEQPIPLTKLKPYNAPEQPIPLVRPKKQVMEMPPREQQDETPAVPSSIKDMLPPIKDTGEEIQVGSEENPAISPRSDQINPRKKRAAAKKPTNKKTSPKKQSNKK